jgi:hypothetical protein
MMAYHAELFARFDVPEARGTVVTRSYRGFAVWMKYDL